MTRNIKSFVVDSLILGELFKKGTFIEVTEGIPDGSEFRGIHFDAKEGMFYLTVEHPSFPRCEPGQQMMRGSIEIKKWSGRKEPQVLKRLLNKFEPDKI